ncbi:hypothetical protein [Pseudomonas helleri]|jgi:hypothetical protein|uniref:hypothetical protein n=1 Tax=Pseudomonas helleri TaxID=1608996 RepID=UPI003A100B74
MLQTVNVIKRQLLKLLCAGILELIEQINASTISCVRVYAVLLLHTASRFKIWLPGQKFVALKITINITANTVDLSKGFPNEQIYHFRISFGVEHLGFGRRSSCLCLRAK